jgi:hypothetical protein
MRRHYVISVIPHVIAEIRCSPGMGKVRLGDSYPLFYVQRFGEIEEKPVLEWVEAVFAGKSRVVTPTCGAP